MVASMRGRLKTAFSTGQAPYTLPTAMNTKAIGSTERSKGKGVARFPNGSVYRGQLLKRASRTDSARSPLPMAALTRAKWEAGAITGQGIAQYANGVRYEGSFRNANHHGKGVIAIPRRL